MKASSSITLSHVTDGLTTHYEYAKNDSNITAPSVGWSPTVPASEAGIFIWRREGHALAGETPSTWSTPICLTGSKGDPGAAGAVGQGVESIIEEYYLSTSKTAQTGGSWVTDPPTWSTGKYMWTRSKITYKNPTDTEYTTPVCDSSWEAVNLTEDELKKYVQSRGENLITNGSGLLGSNYNFSAFTYDGSEAYYSNGSFRYYGSGTKFTDEFMPVNPELAYKLSMFAKTANGVGRYYAMVACFDVDNKSISAQHHMYRANTLTTLSQELKNGDTVVHLTDASNWYNDGTAGVNTHLRSIILWNYKNSYGYLYPPQTYSRNWIVNAWNPGAINFENNTITLISPWAGGTVEAGTPLSNGSSGSTYKYRAMSNTIIPTTWTEYAGVISGIDLSGSNVSDKFSPGTAKVKIGWLLNYQGSGETVWITNLAFNIHLATQSELDSTKLIVNSSVNSTDVEYYLSTSSTSLSGGSWQTTAPAWVDGKFMWSRTRVELNNGTVRYTPSESGTCIAGATGATGDPGEPGVGILAVMAEYISHTSNLSLDGLDEEKEWTPEPPERGSGEYIWMRNVIYYDNETSTITEPVCVTGERGPSGKRGEIGAYVASNTLYIKGFGEDGELTEALGFLYTSNARYLVVASEYLLTEGGVGYIGLSGNEVLVLKIDPQIGYVKWVDYNTGVEKFPDLIFGKIDKKTSGITDVSLITPSITSEFVKLHFMAIMANAVDGTDTTTEEGRNRVEVWADALGVSQFFESIAVLEAFIHALTVNRLNIESNDLKVRVSPDGFVDGGVAYPLFAITDGAGRPILQIDGKNKNLLIETSNGIIRALLQVYNQDGTRVLETEREGGLNTVNKTHTKTLYSVAELKAKATESTEPTTVSSGSSFNGTAFTKQCFRSSAGKLTFGYSPLSVNSGTTAGAKTASLTLPTKLGAQKVVISGTRSYSGTTLRRNGTVISGALPQTFDYIAGDVYEVSATRSSSTYTEYKYYWIKFKATDYGDGNLMWAIQSDGYTGWGSKRSTAGAGTPSYEGQVKTIYYNEETRTQTDYSSNSINLTLTYESAASYPAGFVFITSGGSYLSLPYTSGYLIESSFSIVLNGWSSASNKKYISGSDIIADYNALTANVFYPAKTTNSAVTSYKEPGKTNAPLSSIDTVIRTASSLTFSKGVESRAIVSFEGNGKTGGVYEEFKAHVETIGTTAAVHTANLKPVNSSTNIGESGNKFNAGHFNNLYGKLTGQVNDAGTSNKVYGAVFN